MKTLYLPLKAKWYNMIESGEKLEEYREIKDYWAKRLIDHIDNDNKTIFTKYDNVCFRYGYTKKSMSFDIESISIGEGKKEWGAPDYFVFIIKLGKRIY